MAHIGDKVAIIGAGSVGSAVAFALIMRRLASDVILVDTDKELQHAQVQDLSDAAFLSDTGVHEGTLEQAGQCSLIVVTAGAKQHPGEKRENLIARNFVILTQVISGMMPFNNSAVLLIISNPVDILTYFAQQLSGLPIEQVIGSGTFLDTQRLRGVLADELDVCIHSPENNSGKLTLE